MLILFNFLIQYLGDVVVHNALFGTKIYINQDIPEIVSFRTRLVYYFLIYILY